MAKSLRSKVKKANRTKLRAKVFEPHEDARTRRLSEKLLKLAAESNVVRPSDTQMEVDQTGNEEFRKSAAQDDPSMSEDMDVDSGMIKKSNKSSKHKKVHRIQKRRGKPHSQIVFPTRPKGRSRTIRKNT